MNCAEHGSEHMKWGACYHPDHMQRVIDSLPKRPIRDAWSGHADTDKAWR